jgi:cobalamin-independent methionine synthase catalytic subunit
MRVVAGELPAFPHLAETPDSGVGADMVGRAAAHLIDLHVELTVSGWRFTDRAGADERRSRAALARDLDILEEQLHGFAGPLKIQCAGPWTLAGSLELRYGDKALADPGAVRDIAAALAEGLAGVSAGVAKRVPGASLVVQLDEPLLPAALLGRVPTASGFGTLPIVEVTDAVEKLRVLAQALDDVGATPIAHCCAARPPLRVFADAGLRAVGVDAALVTASDDDVVGELIERGVGLFLGLVPSVEPHDERPLRARELASPARELWSRLGFAPDTLARDVVVTPTCGLAGASKSWPARAYRLCRDVAQALLEEPEDRT